MKIASLLPASLLPGLGLLLVACSSAEPGVPIGQPGPVDPNGGSEIQKPATPAAEPATPATPVKLGSLGNDIVVETAVLGSPAPAAGDACNDSARKHELSLATGAYKFTGCAKGASGKREVVIVQRTITTDELAAVKTDFDALSVTSLPKVCGYDGRAFSITLGNKRYVDDDYNCAHRTDVGYVSPRLAPLETTLTTLANAK